MRWTHLQPGAAWPSADTDPSPLQCCLHGRYSWEFPSPHRSSNGSLPREKASKGGPSRPLLRRRLDLLRDSCHENSICSVSWSRGRLSDPEDAAPHQLLSFTPIPTTPPCLLQPPPPFPAKDITFLLSLISPLKGAGLGDTAGVERNSPAQMRDPGGDWWRKPGNQLKQRRNGRGSAPSDVTEAPAGGAMVLSICYGVGLSLHLAIAIGSPRNPLASNWC